MRKGMFMERIKKRKELRWSMVLMLLTCWFLPLLLTFFIIFFFISDRMNNQLEDTIVTSADKFCSLMETLYIHRGRIHNGKKKKYAAAAVSNHRIA